MSDFNSDHFLERLWPGDTLEWFREKLKKVATTPGLSKVLLHGPPGCGKTTIARALAVMRRHQCIDMGGELGCGLDAEYETVIEKNNIAWYREMSMGAVQRGLIDSQLFGVKKKFATGVEAKIGIFEAAMTGYNETTFGDNSAELGHEELLEKAKNDPENPFPLLTGGVVLLDEIAELSNETQARLLRILNGEACSRLGGEDNQDFSFKFQGLVVMATFRDIKKHDTLRADLRQRIGPNVIRVPSLIDYDDFGKRAIITRVLGNYRKSVTRALNDLIDLCAEMSQTINPAYKSDLTRQIENKQTKSNDLLISPSMVKKLIHVPWDEYDEFRGLEHVIVDLYREIELKDALDRIKEAQPYEETDDTPWNDHATRIYLKKLLQLPENTNISVVIKAMKETLFGQLHRQLDSKDPRIMQMLDAAERPEAWVRDRTRIRCLKGEDKADE